MSPSSKTIEVKVERIIAATPGEAFDAWLDPGIPGTPWNMAEKLILQPYVDGLFYWLVKGTAHYGRFTEVNPAKCLHHTWVSPNTSGLESLVAVTFKQQGSDTLMTLVHSGLPDTNQGRSHDNGWQFFLDGFREQLAKSSAAT
ncbi:MAG: SRPBCC domain-containing protein [Steroidobacter sp.]